MKDKGLLTLRVPTTIKNEKLVEKRRRQIVQAAIRLFGQKGFDATTMRELAEESGLSLGNIYDYVGSKEDIFFLLHEFMVDLVDAGLKESIQHIRDPLEKLRRMVRSEFNLMYEWADSILIIYQESHILKKPSLKPLLERFLQREREHIQKFEAVLSECMEKNVCRLINPRVIANLIKIMSDSWVLKRWDLREHVTQMEMEKAIIDLVSYGVLRRPDSEPVIASSPGFLEGKTAFIMNASTVLGSAMASFLLAKGIRLAIHQYTEEGSNHLAIVEPGVDIRTINKEKISFSDLIKKDWLRRLMKEFGRADFVIHDLGIGNTDSSHNVETRKRKISMLHANFQLALEMKEFHERELARKTGSRVIFIAPWAWDRYVDPLHYQTVKEGAVTLTQHLARNLAPLRINVNCVIPGFLGGTKPLNIEKEKGQSLLKTIPFGHLGEMADVLETLSYLLSDASKYVTGQALCVGGGLTDDHF